MDKILSIIIPTYNMEKYLHKCLDSLIVSDENMQQLEVLVVNDGSKDSSSQIAHEYESSYPQTFRVIDKENGNYGSCINRGLKEATGKYIKVLDADDYFINDSFNRFVTFLQQTDVDLIVNDYCIVDENDKVDETYTFNLPTDRTFRLSDFPKGVIVWLWHHGITYRTELFRQLNYRQTVGISYTDDEWIFKPMLIVEKVVYFPHDMYHYLMGREGQTFDPKVMKSSFDKRIVVGKSMAEFYGKIKDSFSEDAEYYLTEKLRTRTSTIYEFYLIKQNSKEGNRLLKDFDMVMKANAPKVYQILGQSKNRFGGKNCVCAWRDAGFKNTLYMRLLQWRFQISLLLGKEFRNLHMPENYKRKL